MTPQERDGSEVQPSQSVRRSVKAVTPEPKDRVPFTPTSKYIIRWDITLSAVLIYTCFATPYELAFLETSLDSLFVINRICDIVFAVDIWVNFNLAFVTKSGHLITQKEAVHRRYLRTWFLIDFISTIPFDLIAYLSTNGMDSAASAAAATGKSTSTDAHMKLFRLLKVVKLIKLVRVIKLAKTLGRSVGAIKNSRIYTMVASHIRLTNAAEDFIKYFLVVMVTIHWCACIWRIMPDFQGETETWMTLAGYDPQTTRPVVLYMLCYEFSLMALVLGMDGVEPANPKERNVALFILVVSGSVYTYVVGGVCSILSQSDPITASFRQTQDLLGHWCAENKFPAELALTMSQYFTFSKPVFRWRMYGQVVDDLAPSLRARASHYTHKQWLDGVPFFHPSCSMERAAFVLELSLIMDAASFPPEDHICIYGQEADRMYILTRGIAREGKQLFSKPGSYFGEEMLLAFAVCRRTVHSLTMVACVTIARKALDDLFHRKRRAFPETAKLIRRQMVKQRFRNAVHDLGKCVLIVNKRMRPAGRRLQCTSREEIEQHQQRLVALGANAPPACTNEPYPGLARMKAKGGDQKRRLSMLDETSEEKKLAIFDRVINGQGTEEDKRKMQIFADPGRFSAEAFVNPLAISSEKRVLDTSEWLSDPKDADAMLSKQCDRSPSPAPRRVMNHQQTMATVRPESCVLSPRTHPGLQLPTMVQSGTVILEGISEGSCRAAYNGKYTRRPSPSANANTKRHVYEGSSGWIWYNDDKEQWLVGPKAAVGTGRGHMFVADAARTPNGIDSKAVWTAWDGNEWVTLDHVTIVSAANFSSTSDRIETGALGSSVETQLMQSPHAVTAVSEPIPIHANEVASLVLAQLQGGLSQLSHAIESSESKSTEFIERIERRMGGNHQRTLKALSAVEDRVNSLEKQVVGQMR